MSKKTLPQTITVKRDEFEPGQNGGVSKTDIKRILDAAPRIKTMYLRGGK